MQRLVEHEVVRRSPSGRRVLLVRLSAIGDILFASPLIEALRRAEPDTRIAWLVRSDYVGLLDRHPALDEVIPVPLGRWRALLRDGRWRAVWTEIGTLRARLRAARFDLAIDLQGLLKSGVLTWLSGAPERLSLGGREGSRWLMTRTWPRARGGDAIGAEYRALARRLGWPAAPFTLAMHHDAGDAAAAAAWLGEDLAGPGIAALCPFTTRPQKHWLAPRWAALAEALHTRHGLIPVLLGGPGDREAARAIATACRAPLRDLVGQTSLRQAAAVIARARLAVAVDTGLGHMGIALGTPSLLLFGSTCPYRQTGRANAQVIHHGLPCSPCRRRPTCRGTFDCMRAITVEAVLAAAAPLIGRAP